MKRIILLTLLIPVLAQAQPERYGHTSGSTFYWNKSGEAQKSDSLRFIQGSNVTLTQSGNTLTIAGAAGAGSTASVRANVGWTASGTLARDTLYTNYAIFGAKTFGIGGTTQAQNARAKFNVYSYGDSVLVLSASATKSLTDSFLVMLPDGSLKGSGGGNLGFLNVRGNGMQLGSLNLESNSGISDNGYGGYIRLVSTNGAVNLGSSNSNIIRLTPASQVIIGATATKANQAFLTVNANGTADTTLIVRNDKNSTLDSTAMVFADGRIVRRDTKQLPAGAWLATASNGAALSSSNYMVTYAFDTATAETLTVDFALPPNFIQVSNVEIEVISPNTDGDSVGFAIAWLGRAADEAFNVAFSSPLSGQIDLGLC